MTLKHQIQNSIEGMAKNCDIFAETTGFLVGIQDQITSANNYKQQISTLLTISGKHVNTNQKPFNT
jgi:hypothetical protein